jgi:hypothetical protein
MSSVVDGRSPIGFEIGQSIPAEFMPGIYGDFERRDVLLGQIVVARQVRYGKNPVLPQLVESIDTVGRAKNLHNAPDLVYPDADLLADYLDFTNDTYGGNVSIDDCPSQPDGRYYLAAAGHSRIESIWEIERRRVRAARHAGFRNVPPPGEALVLQAKIHIADEPADILRVQMAENIHSVPVEERQAMGIIGMYLYGKRHKSWGSYEEFGATAGRGFDSLTLERAHLFSLLPDVTRGKVMMGGYHYAVACELGRLTGPYITRHLRTQREDDPSLSDADVDFMKAYRDADIFIGSELEHAKRQKYTLKKVRERVANIIDSLNPSLFSETSGVRTAQLKRDATEGDFTLESEDFRNRNRLARRRYADHLRELSPETLQTRSGALVLAASLFDDDPETLDSIRRSVDRSIADYQASVVSGLDELVNNSSSTPQDAQLF